MTFCSLKPQSYYLQTSAKHNLEDIQGRKMGADCKRKGQF